MDPDVERLLAEREQSLEDELAELTKPTGDLGSISFGKRVGEGTSMAVDRLAAVSAQQHLLEMLAEVRRARRRLADRHLRAVRGVRVSHPARAARGPAVGRAVRPAQLMMAIP